MPTIDHDRGVLVVRVVYDGPAFSGKTTSLRTLAEGFGVGVSTPAEEAGRTLFFDWVDYVGGLFEGRQIRCQIVSVPGQPELAARRQLLIDSADAVVLVADTRATAVDRALDVLCDLLPQCRRKEPPVGIVVQANKRDTPDSVPRAELQALLDAIGPSSIVETVATLGEGVREAFVFAVRLALDRVRWLAERGEVPQGPPVVDSPEDLLAQLQGLPAPPARAAQRFATSVVGAPDAGLVTTDSSRSEAEDEDEDVFTPDPMMPGGFIWPPVDGRALLYDLARVGITPRRNDAGDWCADEGAWRCHSAVDALFDDADAGRRALIEWARLHATNLRRLSTGRALILAEAGQGRFRLWQLVRAAPSWEQRIQALDNEPERLARELIDGATQVLRARESLHTPTLRLPCRLATVGADANQQPLYVGLMPSSGSGGLEAEGAQLLERELLPVMQELARRCADFARLAALLRRAHAHEPSAPTQCLVKLSALV